MTLCDEDFDCVGRWLDGEKIELTPPQRRLAEEITAAAAAVGPELDVPPPPGTLHRVHARMKQAAPARSRIFRMGAAAAAVVAALVLLSIPGRPPQPPLEISAELYLREFLKSPAQALEDGIAVVEDELADVELSFVLGEPSRLELTAATLAEELDRHLAGEGSPDDEAQWQEWMESL